MFDKFKKYLLDTDYLLLATVVSLSVIVIIFIYSAGYNPYTGVTNAFYKKQIIWLILGIISFFVVSYINYKQLVKFAPFIYGIGITFLLIVLLLGLIKMGAQRWIGIGPLRIQPSEIFKIVWVISLAWLFMDFDGKKINIVEVLKKALLLIPPFSLVIYQPD